jgi:hypothetical protein
MRGNVSRPPSERPSEARDRSAEEIFQRLSNFRREHEDGEAVQASKRPEIATPDAGAKPKSGLYDPAAEREAPPPEEPKRFVPSVRPINIPTPRDSGSSQN